MNEILMQKVEELPPSCIDDVFRYIDLCVRAYKNDSGNTNSNDAAEFFGTMSIDADPLLIQRRMRDEWQ